MQFNKDTFQLIRKIEAAQSREEADKTPLIKYMSLNYIKTTFPSSYVSVLTGSARLLFLSVSIYFFNFVTVSLLFFLKFQLFSIFALAYAVLIFILAPVVTFFTTHYPLIYSARASSELFKKSAVVLSLTGFILQSLCWCLMGLGLLNGASGGIFSVLNLFNSKEWPLSIIGTLNLICLTVSLLSSLHLEQKIIRTLLMK